SRSSSTRADGRFDGRGPGVTTTRMATRGTGLQERQVLLGSTPTEAARPRPARRPLTRAAIAVAYLLMLALAALVLFPYYFMAITWIKPRELFYTRRYALILGAASLEPYLQAMTIGRVAVYLRNSVTYATSVAVAQLFIDSLAAFAFARLVFPGRDALFAL